MLQTVKGIVLATVRYNDKSNIAHLYTEQGRNDVIPDSCRPLA